MRSLRDIIGRIVSVFSRLHNALRFGGHDHHTLSARSYRDSVLHGGVWEGRRKRIDRKFRNDAPHRLPHCEKDWERHITRCLQDLKDDKEIRAKLRFRADQEMRKAEGGL